MNPNYIGGIRMARYAGNANGVSKNGKSMNTTTIPAASTTTTTAGRRRTRRRHRNNWGW